MTKIDLFDPRTGQSRGATPASGEAAVREAVQQAREAQREWGRTPVAVRSRRLLDLAAQLESSREDFAAAEAAGTGKPLHQARAEVAASIDVFRFYAGAVRADLTPASGQHLPGRESWVRWEALGVVGVIVPWNYPLLMAAWRLGPALATGNAVVLKPAETTPDTALLLERHAAGILGQGVLTCVPGGRETGQLLANSEVDALAFTGSHAGGSDVARRAGIRRVSLELGGNCPVAVLPGPPGYSYEAIVAACVYNAGQSCAAPARVITLRENYHETVERLAEAMSAQRAGQDFGPLNSLAQLERFDRIIAASDAQIRHVARVDTAAGEADGYWRAGQILADVAGTDPAVTEELFGPVLTVQVADDLAGIAQLANSVPNALAASVWGGTVGQSLRLATEIDAGEVWINCHLEQTAELPHGGRRRSGNGTDLSVLAMAEYQRPKTVTVRLD